MRQHFHRCQNLRVISVDASDIAGDRSGGSAILDELCLARGLGRCVGLADCDVLTDGQRRELLVARVTELRERTGGASLVGDLGAARGREISELAEELLAERDEILRANRRVLAEATSAFDDRADGTPLGTPEDLSRPDLAARLPALRTDRLDGIDRALEEMAGSSYGLCARCREMIEVDWLRRNPDSRVCEACARAAPPLP
jgi:RNA polymerase-binding transcription factor DksA